jgi:hypothetical protein
MYAIFKTGMVVLTKANVADSSIRTAANWFAVQVEAGGSGLARDEFNIKRFDRPVNENSAIYRFFIAGCS